VDLYADYEVMVMMVNLDYRILQICRRYSRIDVGMLIYTVARYNQQAERLTKGQQLELGV
jgi:hypothetical protein